MNSILLHDYIDEKPERRIISPKVFLDRVRLQFRFIQICFNTAHRLPVVFPALVKMLARLVFPLSLLVFGLSRHFAGLHIMIWSQFLNIFIV